MRTSRARLLGLLVALLGAFGGVAPYAGPRFHYRMGAGAAWQWTTERWQLHAAPGAAAVLGGLLLLVAAPRAAARLGAFLALLAGAWFVVGAVVAPIWLGTTSEGQVASTTLRQAAHPLGYHYGTGLLIVAAAAYAWAGCAASVRSLAYPHHPPPGPAAAPHTDEAAGQTSRIDRDQIPEPADGERWWARRQPATENRPRGSRL